MKITECHVLSLVDGYLSVKGENSRGTAVEVTVHLSEWTRRQLHRLSRKDIKAMLENKKRALDYINQELSS